MLKENSSSLLFSKLSDEILLIKQWAYTPTLSLYDLEYRLSHSVLIKSEMNLC